MQQHICKGCGVNKPASEYRIHKRGYRIGKCRDCEREYQREWSSRDPEKYRRRKRESMARRRASDPEAARQREREMYHANRGARLIAMKEYQQRRFFWLRATKLKGATARDLASMWKRQRGRCALTGARLDRTAQVDHIIPKARGGLDDLDNLQWVSAAANLAKRDLTQAEFVALCDSVMRWLGERIAMVDAMENAEHKEAA